MQHSRRPLKSRGQSAPGRNLLNGNETADVVKEGAGRERAADEACRRGEQRSRRTAARRHAAHIGGGTSQITMSRLP